MSQSRFSIVLVGVSALLRRPLVSRLRPADGERSPWVVFTARGGRFDSGGRSAGWPSGSLLPLFGTHRFGVAAGRVRSSAFRFGNSAGRVGLRAHCFRFSACTDSGLPLGELVLPPSASEILFGGLVLPLGGWPSGSLLPLFGMHRFGVVAGRVRSSAFRFGDSARRVGLRTHGFRFSARTASEWLLGEFVLPPSASEIPLDGLVFGLPLRRLPSAGWFFRSVVGLRVHCFRFSARTDPHRRAAEARTDGAQRHDTCFTSNTYPNMLTYHIVRRKHFKTGKLLYYPQLVTPVADDHMHIIERIEKKCTLASADVKAVVDALEVEIIDSLRQGRSVRLGDLGSFRPTLRCSAGVGLPELAGVGQIKRVHVVFHPSSRIRRALSVKDHAVSFVQRDKKKHGANAQQGGSPTGGGTPGAPAAGSGTSAAGSAVTPPGTPVPAPPSTGTPAGTPVPAAPSTTTSTTTGTPAPSTGSSAAGSAVTPPGTPVPAPPSTGTPAGTPVPAAPSTGTPAGTPVPAAPSTGTPAGTPVPAAPSTGTPAVSGTPAAGGA